MSNPHNPSLPHGHQAVPKGALWAACALVSVTILGVATVRLSGVSIHEPDAQAVMVKQLRFEDMADGGIAIIDVGADKSVRTISGEQGFLRGALRALARERRMRSVGPEQPFELIGRADGRLTLFDPATGQHIDLESFGPTNAGVFARLLEAQ
jgi:putative photosynthetic complex assembly protein